jgi:MFS transporter, DHA1 family, multidrug resistance protein
MLEQSIKSYQSRIIIEKKWLFILILTLMSTAGLVGSDVYLPTLPNIGAALQKDPDAMQFTLAIYLFGLSVGQLLLGPLTDRFGRKKLILIGMLLYFFASLFCAYSFSYHEMLVCRFLQALGACSGLTIGRAIVGDIYDAKEAGKIFSTIFPVVGMSPAISPVIGGFLGYYFGWHSTFIFVAVFAITVALLSLYFLPETLAPEKMQPLHIFKVISTYPKLLINKSFLGYVLVPCFAYIVYFAYIAQSPFIFHAHGFTEKAIGTFYITLSITYVTGNLTGKYLLNTFSLNRIIYWGFIAFNMGGLLLLLAGFFGWPLYVMVFAASIVTFGNGFLIPLGIAGVMSASVKTKGYASGLLGFLQLGTAALSSSWVGSVTQNSIYKLGIFIFSATIIGFLCFIIFIKNLKGEAV